MNCNTTIDSIDIIKKALGKEKTPTNEDIPQKPLDKKGQKTFDWDMFKQRSWPWLLGGGLSLFPSLITSVILLIEGNGDKVTFLWFFDNIEIIYICLMLAVIMIHDTVSTKRTIFLWFSLFVIILCAGVYGHLKHRTLDLYNSSGDTPYLWIFTLLILSFVVIIGLANYIILSIKDKECLK
jgi:hypothetical protein